MLALVIRILMIIATLPRRSSQRCPGRCCWRCRAGQSGRIPRSRRLAHECHDSAIHVSRTIYRPDARLGAEDLRRQFPRARVIEAMSTWMTYRRASTL